MNQKRKILITTDLYTTNTNGVVTSVQNLFNELTAMGHDVRILTISDSLHSHKEGAVHLFGYKRQCNSHKRRHQRPERCIHIFYFPFR